MQFFASAFSARLASCHSGQVDVEIRNLLIHLLELLDASRVSWYKLRNGDQNLVLVYTAVRPGTAACPEIVTRTDVPCCAARLLGGQKVTLRSIDDLPRAATRDREFLRRHSVRALLLIPSNCDSADKGVLAVSYASRRKWSSSLLNELEMLGNVIVAAAERKAAQDAHHESERRFRALFEQATIGIALEDLDGRIRYANPALSKLLGRNQPDLLQMKCENFKDHEQSKDERALFRKLTSGQIDSYEMEKRYTRKDGSTIIAQLHASLLKGSETEQPLVIAMVEDITQRKTAEEELKRAKIDLQMLAARLIQAQDEERHRISRELHDDIGQRFSLFASTLEELRDGLSTLRWNDYSRRASNLLNQVNDLASDIHKLSHRLHSSKLEHLGLCAALKELMRQLSKHGIVGTLKCHLRDESLPSDIALGLFRVTQEALTNVIRHSKAKTVFIRVTEVNSAIRLTIKDSGAGFDLSSKPEGLGLISMRERLRILGGTLTINSEPKKGTEILAEVQNTQSSSAIISTAA